MLTGENVSNELSYERSKHKSIHFQPYRPLNSYYFPLVAAGRALFERLKGFVDILQLTAAFLRIDKGRKYKLYPKCSSYIFFSWEHFESYHNYAIL